ncbi:hypothetical protein [Maritalea sp.]|uniref:hypothetical protein n=1 Tax=Maritalea sp. TaxID=2003361 RepID=UPI003EF36294
MSKEIDPERLAYQKALKAVCADVRQVMDCTWPVLLNHYMKLGVGTDYQKMLDRGLVSEKNAEKIRQWLIAHEIDKARKLHPEHFPSNLVTGWQGFVDERGAYGKLTTIPVDGLQLHDIAIDHPINPIRIKAGQPFYLELDAPIAGSAIGLDRYKNEWYPLSLRSDKSFDPVRITRNTYGFPIKDSDPKQVTPFRQPSFDGEHGHCIIIGPHDLMTYYARYFAAKTALPLDTLDKMAERLAAIDASKLAVVRENVLFA